MTKHTDSPEFKEFMRVYRLPESEKPVICDCDCHTPGTMMMHVVECCHFCEKCEQRIIREEYDAHTEACGGK